MPSNSQLILDEAAFVADINPVDIPDGNLEKLSIGLKWATNTTTAISVTEGLTQLTLLRLYNNGLKTEISGLELFALNCLKLGRVPFTLAASNTAHYRGFVSGLELPVNKPTGSKSQVGAAFTANAVNELSTIAVHGTYRDRLLSGLIGYQRKPITPATTAAFGNRVSLALSGAKLAGLLLMSTTVPVVTATTTSLHRLRLLNKSGVLTEWNWNNISDSDHLQTGIAGLDTILDNYRYIEIDEPINAEDLTADIYADDTGACVVIPEYIFG
jgi:hypothetical protein